MGNIGTATGRFEVLPLRQVTEPSPGVPAPEPMPAPYPEPVPEPAPISGPPSPEPAPGPPPAPPRPNSRFLLHVR